jgi:hypothetical protein
MLRQVRQTPFIAGPLGTIDGISAKERIFFDFLINLSYDFKNLARLYNQRKR